MLSYLHAFHAGNFADVLKHTVLVEILNYFKQKEKPFCYLDTHAGSGLYRLDSEYALKNKEFDSGITKLWQRHDLPELVKNYVDVIAQVNSNKQLQRYAGSPVIAQKILSEKDRLFLYELHSTEFHSLDTFLARKDKRVEVFHEDGLTHSLKRLPPVQKRGVIMIDPSYEIKKDYKQVVSTLVAMHKRFETGCYALWYPVIERDRNMRLEKDIKNSGLKNVQLFELSICHDDKKRGMNASGMIIMNPPWTLVDKMRVTLPWLADVLGENDASYRIETLVDE